jgi:hypothetical protein
MAGTKNWQDGAHNCRAFPLRCWQEGQEGGKPGVSSEWRFALIPVDDQSGAGGLACLREELATETNPPL